MLKDRYGNGVSTASRAALAHYDAALELIRLYRGDPIAALDLALAADPGFTQAWTARGAVLAQQMDAVLAPEAARSLAAGAALAGGANDQERAHLGAAQAWADGRFEEAAVRYARIAQENPRDLFAVQSAHAGCFFLGRQTELRDWPAQALRAFAPGDDGRHALLGMAAFGFEECGDYARAQALGTEATEIEPRDGWAAHAVAHVHEMRGDTDAGIAWLEGGAGGWAPDSGFAYHNWWHLGLLHIDRGAFAPALALYDEKVRPQVTGFALEWIDSAALLWRLRLEGADVGERWHSLAECWARAAEDGLYAFNDWHAIIAFLGAGRWSDVERTLAAMRRAAAGHGDNAMMTRVVGLPVAEAFAAFERGAYGEAAETLLSVRGVAQRFGGSHAQRDLITLTALNAAIAGGMKQTAEALAAERVTHKPHSPWALRLAARAAKAGARAAA